MSADATMVHEGGEMVPVTVARRVPTTVWTSLAAVLVSVLVIAVSDGGAALRVGAIAIMLVAAVEDLRTRRLRNAFVGPAFVLAVGADPALSTVAAAVICVAPFMAMAFWKPGSMGMGDVKFAAPAGALVGLQLLGTLLIAIALLGGVLAMIAFVRHGRSATLAYGPAIALATLYVAFVI